MWRISEVLSKVADKVSPGKYAECVYKGFGKKEQPFGTTDDINSRFDKALASATILILGIVLVGLSLKSFLFDLNTYLIR